MKAEGGCSALVCHARWARGRAINSIGAESTKGHAASSTRQRNALCVKEATHIVQDGKREPMGEAAGVHEAADVHEAAAKV